MSTNTRGAQRPPPHLCGVQPPSASHSPLPNLFLLHERVDLRVCLCQALVRLREHRLDGLRNMEAIGVAVLLRHCATTKGTRSFLNKMLVVDLCWYFLVRRSQKKLSC